MKPVTALSLLVGKRKPKPMNLLIGSEGAVIRELEKKFNTKISKFDPDAPAMFSYLELELDIPIGVRETVAIWDNPVLSKNIPALLFLIHNIVPTLPKDKAEPLAKSLSYDLVGIRDFRVLYWSIYHRATNYVEQQWPKDPWDDPQKWATGDLRVRLSKLHRDIKIYTYVKVDNKRELDALGVSKANINRLKTKNHSNILMYKTMVQLAKWKAKQLDEYQTALTITDLWSPK